MVKELSVLVERQVNGENKVREISDTINEIEIGMHTMPREDLEEYVFNIVLGLLALEEGSQIHNILVSANYVCKCFLETFYNV